MREEFWDTQVSMQQPLSAIDLHLSESGQSGTQRIAVLAMVQPATAVFDTDTASDLLLCSAHCRRCSHIMAATEVSPARVLLHSLTRTLGQPPQLPPPRHIFRLCVLSRCPAVIWDAIKAACEADDMATTRLILETAGVIVAKPDLTVMYDERGVRYVLPKYVLSDPNNLVKEEVQLTQLQQQQRA